MAGSDIGLVIFSIAYDHNLLTSDSAILAFLENTPSMRRGNQYDLFSRLCSDLRRAELSTGIQFLDSMPVPVGASTVQGICRIGEKAMAYTIPDSMRVLLKNAASASFAFTCGPRKPLFVTVEYAAQPNEKSGWAAYSSRWSSKRLPSAPPAADSEKYQSGCG